MIIFRVLCGEWIESMWDWYGSSIVALIIDIYAGTDKYSKKYSSMLVGDNSCVPFFLASVVIGNLVVLNLFLALLLSSFGASNLSSPQADAETNKLAEAFHRISRFFRWLKNFIKDKICLLYKAIKCSKKRQKKTEPETNADSTSLASSRRSRRSNKNGSQHSDSMKPTGIQITSKEPRILLSIYCNHCNVTFSAKEEGETKSKSKNDHECSKVCKTFQRESSRKS